MKNFKKMAGILLITAVLAGCSKDKNNNNPVIDGNVIETTQTANGITFKVFTDKNSTQFKGILVMGSGNDETNPSPGSLNESVDVDLCKKAAAGGYVAAIVQYRKTLGDADWNASAQIIGDDYNTCITDLSTKYNVDKARSVAGGYSYASFMLLTNSAYFNSIPYCKGILAPCGATGADQAGKLHNPIFSIACSADEGEYSGKALYDQIPANSAIKASSTGITDNSCDTHCGGSWTDQLYQQLTEWLP